jgi:hypothetical protein
MSDDRQLWQRLGCFGYYGFGGGWALAGLPRPDDTNATACGKCEQRGACWIAHKDRVRRVVPDLAAIADDVAKQYKGADYIRVLMARTGQTDRSKLVEPFLSVMMANTADGARVAQGTKPRARGEHTLRWPLEPIRVVGS